MNHPEQRRVVATKLLNRKHGATVQQLSNKLRTDERKVRSLIDNLRRSGHTIENTAPCRFRLTH